MCVIMSNMRQVSVREVQHNLARVLRLVEEGEELEITRRDAVVARIVPATSERGIAQRRPRPDFRARLAAIYGDRPLTGSGAADEVIRGRSREE